MRSINFSFIAGNDFAAKIRVGLIYDFMIYAKGVPFPKGSLRLGTVYDLFYFELKAMYCYYFAIIKFSLKEFYGTTIQACSIKLRTLKCPAERDETR